MINGSVRQGIENVARFFAENPGKGLSRDKSAVAIVEEGLRCRAEGPNGAVMISDMPKAIGGGGTAPTPGWFLRAALANCDATVIAMRAAQLGVDLTTLEVTVDSESDDRGLLGVGGAEVLPGPVGISVRVRIAAAASRRSNSARSSNGRRRIRPSAMPFAARCHSRPRSKSPAQTRLDRSSPGSQCPLAAPPAIETAWCS